MQQPTPEPHSSRASADRRQQAIEGLFDEVRDLSVEEREARIAAAPVADDIRAAVRSLLAYDGDTVTATRAPLEAFDPMSCLGLSIGGFTIRAIIGSGGMGTVYAAEQERPQRSVALKVLGAAGTRPSVSRRFLRESDFLARLDHPGIARVISAGVLRAPGGGERPYFAMELVAGGRPITRWARESGASRDDVLRAFADACDAVGAGHRAGVAHLDLKPGNILMGADGRARIIDYGIARSMRESEDEADADRGVIGTPQYMSPEQFSAGAHPVDSRADVYALGLVLYELVTGRLPYETRGLGMRSVARVVAEVEPAAPRLIDARVPRAVDAVISRAIAKSPDARYGTASEIADDLRRFLADEPVVAAPSTPIQDAMRFVRKRRLLSAVAMLALCATLSAVAVGGRLLATSREAAARSARAASIANLRAAAACLREDNPADGARLLDRVQASERGWETRHIVASIRRFELLASIGSEILHLSVAGGTGEIACGVSSGFVTIIDPVRPEPYEIHDLRDTFSGSEPKYFPTICISSDGRRVLAPNAVGKVLYLDRDIGSWRELPVSGVWSGFGRNMLIVADGRSITTIRPDGTEPLATRSLPSNPIAMSIARHGRFASVFCADGAVAMYAIDPDSGAVEERWRTASITRRPRAITMSDDGRSVFVVTRDGEIVRLDGGDGSIARRAELSGGAVFEIAASRDGRMLAASSWTSVVRVIDAESLEIVDRLGGTLSHVWGIDFTPDDKGVVGRVIVARPDPRAADDLVEWVGAFRLDRRGATRDIDLGRDLLAADPMFVDGRACVLDATGELSVVSTEDGSIERIGRIDGEARVLRRSGDAFYLGFAEGAVHRFDRDADGALVERWRVAVLGASITALELSPDGSMLACGGRARAMAMLDANSGALRWRVDLPAGKAGPERQRVSGFSYGDGGATVVPISVDTAVRTPVLAVTDGREIRVFMDDPWEVESVASMPDGRLFGLGVTGSLARLGEGATLRTTPIAQNGGIIRAMPGEQERLLVAARDGLLRILAVDSSAEDDGDALLDGVDDLMKLELPPGNAIAIGFDPARDEVAVVTSRGRIRVWSGKADPRTIPRAGNGQLEQRLIDDAARSPHKPG